MWEFLLVCFSIMFIWEIYSILTGKPTRKSAFKRCVNRWAYLLLGFGMAFNVEIILILAIVGNQELAKSTNIDCIAMANGISWMFNIIMMSFLFVAVLDALNILIRKGESQIFSIYFNWCKKLNEEGFFKYTEEEKEYNKAEDVKGKEQIRRWFPFIKKFDKKVKDGTL